MEWVCDSSELIVYLLYRSGSAIANALPLPVLFVFGEFLGFCAWIVSGKYRRLAQRNVAIAFGNEQSPGELRRLVRRHFRRLGANLLCSIKLTGMPLEKMAARIEGENLDFIHRELRSGRPVVLILSHLANWELFAHILPKYIGYVRNSTIYQRLGNRFIDEHVRRVRRRAGVEMFDRKEGFDQAIKLLRGGGAIGILSDQHAGDHGVWVPFFGRLASTSPLPALLAKRTRAALIGVAPMITRDQVDLLGHDNVVRAGQSGLRSLDIQPTAPPAEPAPKSTTTAERILKRSFDIVFALIAIVFTLPLYPFVMLAIWIEDGRPFFFGHKRETIGGREFFCWKFRSMRKDAERIKAQLKTLNQADGPQFYIENDPRLTRVGRLLRKYNLDELPQFFNVLIGDMSIVGPRPSPHHENQYCPPWREARLSVRPGITGLWQVKRTRKAGNDFQEWIKYDIEYVERRTFWLDLVILWKTVANVFGKLSRN